jgi:hypothetical protein
VFTQVDREVGVHGEPLIEVEILELEDPEVEGSRWSIERVCE